MEIQHIISPETLELTALDSPWEVVLHNDDVNTFSWVIDSLIEICEHNQLQAEQCSMIVHYKGKCSVKLGAETKMMALARALCDRGLSATITEAA